MIKHLKMIFCRHKEVEPCVETGHHFHHLQGKRIYYRCRRCGKIVRSEFLTNEDLLARFGRYL